MDTVDMARTKAWDLLNSLETKTRKDVATLLGVENATALVELIETSPELAIDELARTLDEYEADNMNTNMKEAIQACIQASVAMGIEPPTVKGQPFLGKVGRDKLINDALVHISALEDLFAQVYDGFPIWKGINKYNLGVAKDFLVTNKEALVLGKDAKKGAV